MTDHLDWRQARLLATRDLTPDIRLFEIEPEGAFAQPSPGSHITVTVQIGERADTRTYSTVGPCADGRYRIAVKRLAESRGGSAYMWRLEPGARLTIAMPRNHFELSRRLPGYLLLAGGIGITPIYSMAVALAGAGANVRMLYAVRRACDLAFGEELTALLGDRLGVFIDAQGERPHLDDEIARLAPGGELYVCGPIGLLDAARRAWAAAGRPIEKLRFETFGNSGRFAPETFRVKIPRLGREFDVAPNQTMLAALEAAGVDMIYDCQRGECGLCALLILSAEGMVDHRDVFFSDEEKAANTKLCTCVSRVVGGSITIDTADRLGS